MFLIGIILLTKDSLCFQDVPPPTHTHLLTPLYSFQELGSENLRTMLYILQAYMLLSPGDFLRRAGVAINNALQVETHGIG